ncbi:MAG: TerB family tellurite resistance protein [Kiritimatiellae bacterium]|nr:TerB family tellurite resistance protein [Kiritimatiellia bacterium]
MGWKGIAIGGYIGSIFGGPLGSILGAALGHKVESMAFGGDNRRPGYAEMPPGGRSMIFCASVAAMMAKLAKADGAVTRDEIDGVEEAFRRLGFTPSARRYAVNVFRKAKDDSHSIYEYAREFAGAVSSVEVRELFYEILWDIACVDGAVSEEELVILQRIPRSLGIRPGLFDYFFVRRIGSRRAGAPPPPPRDPLADAYAMLGAKPSDGADTLRRKYRELAKRNHPDALRAQGLPDEMVGKATERMSRINSAWAAIKEARNI